MTTNSIAPPGGTTDAYTTVQNSLNSNDVTILQAGNWYFSAVPTVKNGHSLKGEGQGATSLHCGIQTDTSAGFCTISDMWIDPTGSGTNCVVVNSGGTGITIRYVVGLFGQNGLYNKGVDCVFENCYFGNPVASSGAAVLSQGAADYIRCKLDTDDGAYSRPSPCYGFYQGDSILGNGGGYLENHIIQTDLSGGGNGGYTKTVYVSDSYNAAELTFTGSILGSETDVHNCRNTKFIGCEIGGNMVNNNGHPMQVVGCIGVGTTFSVSGSGVSKGGNIRIS